MTKISEPISAEFVLDGSCQTAVRPDHGSVVSFTPATGEWEVEFKQQGDTWREPVLGWAVVVSTVDYEGKGRFFESANYEADIQPVVIWAGRPLPVSRVVAENEDLKWSLPEPYKS